MTSYDIWVVARSGKYYGLNTIGRLGDELSQKRVWEHYTQLPIQQAKFHFKRINDALIFVVIFRLTGDVGYCLSAEAMKGVQEWGIWFLQNQCSTYILVSGFMGKPFLLPRYCNDCIIILVYSRKIVGMQSLLTLKHKTGVTFTIIIGHYACQNIPAAKSAVH